MSAHPVTVTGHSRHWKAVDTMNANKVTEK